MHQSVNQDKSLIWDEIRALPRKQRRLISKRNGGIHIPGTNIPEMKNRPNQADTFHIPSAHVKEE